MQTVRELRSITALDEGLYKAAQEHYAKASRSRGRSRVCERARPHELIGFGVGDSLLRSKVHVRSLVQAGKPWKGLSDFQVRCKKDGTEIPGHEETLRVSLCTVKRLERPLSDCVFSVPETIFVALRYVTLLSHPSGKPSGLSASLVALTCKSSCSLPQVKEVNGEGLEESVREFQGLQKDLLSFLRDPRANSSARQWYMPESDYYFYSADSNFWWMQDYPPALPF